MESSSWSDCKSKCTLFIQFKSIGHSTGTNPSAISSLTTYATTTTTCSTKCKLPSVSSCACILFCRILRMRFHRSHASEYHRRGATERGRGRGDQVLHLQLHHHVTHLLIQMSIRYPVTFVQIKFLIVASNNYQTIPTRWTTHCRTTATSGTTANCKSKCTLVILGHSTGSKFYSFSTTTTTITGVSFTPCVYPVILCKKIVTSLINYLQMAVRMKCSRSLCSNGQW